MYLDKRFTTLGLSAAALLLAASLTPAHAQAKDEIRVPIQRTTTALPIEVAQEKGLFANHFVAAKYTFSQVQISDSFAALGRQFDIAMGTQPALIAAAGQG